MTQEELDKLLDALNRRAEEKQQDRDPSTGYSRLSEKREALARQQANFSLQMVIAAGFPTILGVIAVQAFDLRPIPMLLLKVWGVWVGLIGVIFVLGQINFSLRQNALR